MINEKREKILSKYISDPALGAALRGPDPWGECSRLMRSPAWRDALKRLKRDAVLRLDGHEGEGLQTWRRVVLWLGVAAEPEVPPYTIAGELDGAPWKSNGRGACIGAPRAVDREISSKEFRASVLTGGEYAPVGPGVEVPRADGAQAYVQFGRVRVAPGELAAWTSRLPPGYALETAGKLDPIRATVGGRIVGVLMGLRY